MIIQKSDKKGCLTLVEFEQYVKGGMNSQEMHEVEKHLLSCQLCNDAVEGRTSMVEPVKMEEIYEILNTRISERTGYTQEVKTVPVQPWVLSMAAVVLIGLMITFIIYRKSDTLNNQILSTSITRNEPNEIRADSALPISGNSNTEGMITQTQNDSIPVKTKLIAVVDPKVTLPNSSAGNREKLQPAKEIVMENTIQSVPEKNSNDLTTTQEKATEENIQPSIEINDEGEKVAEQTETQTTVNIVQESKLVSTQNENSSFNKQKMKKSYPAEKAAGGQASVSAITNSRQPGEQKAYFPGGESALRKFVEDNLKYPQKARDEKTEGKVTLEFLVDTEGRIKDLIIKNTLTPELDAEALRLISSMPLWKPANSDGHVVESKIELPVEFRLR